MHPYDRACEYALQRNAVADAKEWIRDQTNGPRCIWEFSVDESIQIVDTIYARGADTAFVMGDEDVINTCGSVDMLLIHLPQVSKYREALFEFEHMVAKETGFDESIDEGQKYILLRWT